jgi:hypothetical protein
LEVIKEQFPLGKMAEVLLALGTVSADERFDCGMANEYVSLICILGCHQLSIPSVEYERC